jgi:hypothetical protein
MNRKVVHSIVYIGVFITFPHLPLSGVKVLLDLTTNTIAGARDEAVNHVGEHIKDKFIHDSKDLGHVLTQPIGIIPKLFEKFNPFQ